MQHLLTFEKKIPLNTILILHVWSLRQADIQGQLKGVGGEKV